MAVSIAVIGDFYVDSILFDFPKVWRSGLTNLEHWLENDEAGASMLVQRPGGAVLVAEMVKEYVDGKGGAAGPDSLVRCFSYDVNNLLSTWPLKAACRMAPFKAAGTDKKNVYRVKEFLGWLIREFNPISITTELGRLLRQKLIHLLPDTVPAVAEEFAQARIVTIIDQNRGFRAVDPADWIAAVGADFELLIWQLDIEAKNSLKSELANHILTKLYDKTIVITKAEHLRKCGVQFKQDESIETVLEEFDRLLRNPRFAELAKCRGWIVWLDEGAVLFDRDAGTISCITCPAAISAGMDSQAGSTYGGFAIITAAVSLGAADAMAIAGGEILAGVGKGVRLGTLLQVEHVKNGYAKDDFLKIKNRRSPHDLPIVPYPFRELFRRKNSEFMEETEDAEGQPRKTTKVEYRLAQITLKTSRPWAPGSVSRVQLYWDQHALTDEAKVKKAIGIVINGPDVELFTPANIGAPANRWFPEAELHCCVPAFGKVRSGFRQEIEGYTSVEGLIRNYLASDDMKAPLCLATFGRPGSGKSLAVKQIAKMIDESIAERMLEFNVAQFNSIDDLAVAFHQVHDRAMGGSIPLVIFDEFDCEFEHHALGWLKYFLAPMNDGKFRDERTVYNVGRAIFLFAGGTTESFEEFDHKSRHAPDAAALKLPDFISRLRGHLNILGINSPDDQPVDSELLFRRAILFRSLVEAHAPHVINQKTKVANIDRDLVFAFLQIPSFKHGGRSIQAILEMAAISGAQKFHKTSLPLSHQLDMHVNSEKFLQLIASAHGI